MRRFLSAILALLLIAPLSRGADAPKGFKTSLLNIGYMRQEDLGNRVAVKELGDYFKRLEADCTEFFAEDATAENLSVVVAVKPGKLAKVWLVSSLSPAPAERGAKLRARLEAIAPPIVRGGPIAFAIEGKIAGGQATEGAKDGPPPTPTEWQAAIESLKEPTLFDGLLAKIWPDTEAEKASAATAVPEGFVMQVLEPTGGHIPRPKDWFYQEGHRGQTCMWTISKEDISKGASYTTGVRIQAFFGVKEKTGKTPKEFILGFVESKKKAAAKVIEACEPKEQGMFTRICLQTEEGPHRILYSLFWANNDLDLAAVTISGTAKELWETYAPIFDQMSAVDLIDMKRFEKKP